MARLQLIFPFVNVKVDPRPLGEQPPMALARRAKRDAPNHGLDGTGRPASSDGGMAATYNEFAATTLRLPETKAAYFRALRSTSLEASRVALIDLRAVALDIDDSPSLPKLSDAAFEVVDSYLRTSAVPRAPPPLVDCAFPALVGLGAREAQAWLSATRPELSAVIEVTEVRPALPLVRVPTTAGFTIEGGGEDFDEAAVSRGGAGGARLVEIRADRVVLRCNLLGIVPGVPRVG